MQELRAHPRFRATLSVEVLLSTGPLWTSTTTISLTGLSLRLPPPLPPLTFEFELRVELPDGSFVRGTATVQNHPGQEQVGMAFVILPQDQLRWERFVDEEGHTGSLWRMIERIAEHPDDALAARGLMADGTRRFHTVGENGLAYRLAFAKHPADPPDESDLCVRLPGFRERCGAVKRVLRHDIIVRIGKDREERLRVVEMTRGSFAGVSTDKGGVVLFTSLGTGELVLTAVGDEPVFPFFTVHELEQIACDAFRHDLSRPLFSAPRPVDLPTVLSVPAAPAPDPGRFRRGVDAVRFAQAASGEVQTRRYGRRDIYFHPAIWARVRGEGGEVIGPTMQDGPRICVLALVGDGAPRVVRLSDDSDVELLKAPLQPPR